MAYVHEVKRRRCQELCKSLCERQDVEGGDLTQLMLCATDLHSHRSSEIMWRHLASTPLMICGHIFAFVEWRPWHIRAVSKRVEAMMTQMFLGGSSVRAAHLRASLNGAAVLDRWQWAPVVDHASYGGNPHVLLYNVASKLALVLEDTTLANIAVKLHGAWYTSSWNNYSILGVSKNASTEHDPILRRVDGMMVAYDRVDVHGPRLHENQMLPQWKRLLLWLQKMVCRPFANKGQNISLQSLRLPLETDKWRVCFQRCRALTGHSYVLARLRKVRRGYVKSAELRLGAAHFVTATQVRCGNGVWDRHIVLLARDVLVMAGAGDKGIFFPAEGVPRPASPAELRQWSLPHWSEATLGASA